MTFFHWSDSRTHACIVFKRLVMSTVLVMAPKRAIQVSNEPVFVLTMNQGTPPDLPDSSDPTAVAENPTAVAEDLTTLVGMRTTFNLSSATGSEIAEFDSDSEIHSVAGDSCDSGSDGDTANPAVAATRRQALCQPTITAQGNRAERQSSRYNSEPEVGNFGLFF